MSRYRKIHISMYADKKFGELSKPQPNAQTLWIYLLTGPHTMSFPGLFRAGEASMAEALDWKLKDFRACFAELSKRGMIRADWKARVVWIPNAIKYNHPESPNVVKSWGKTWDEVPDCELKTMALASFKALLKGFGKGFREACSESFENPSAKVGQEVFDTPSANQEQEQEHEQEYLSKASRRSPGEGPPPHEVNESHRKAAYAAMEQWSNVSRGHGLDSTRNENRKISEMLDVLAQKPPILRGSEQIPQHVAVPQAADIYRIKASEFKSVAYACGCVVNLLDEWKTKGMPGASGAMSNGKHASKPPLARTND